MSRKRRHAGAAAGPALQQSPGKVRIIAGQWRGSRLDVPALPGLRPSSDRVRETVFNWLQGEIAGARCLDLFAGSGALGFEAASRGAAQVCLIEQADAALTTLRDAARRLDARQVEIIRADALAWLARTADRQFDLVFIDPPFAADLHQKALTALLPWLAARAIVYVEAAREQGLPTLPPGFSWQRQSGTRDVLFGLAWRKVGPGDHDHTEASGRSQ